MRYDDKRKHRKGKWGIAVISRVDSLGLSGISGYPVSVECFITNGLPVFEIVGLPDAAGRGDSGGTGRVSSARSGGGALRFRSERLRYIRYIRGRFALFRPPVGGAPLPRGGESREIDYIYRCFGLRRDVSDGKTI